MSLDFYFLNTYLTLSHLGRYPIRHVAQISHYGVKTDAVGKIKFLIDEIENFDTN